MTPDISVGEMMRRQHHLIGNYHMIIALSRAMTPDEMSDMIERAMGPQEKKEEHIAFLGSLYDLPDEERLSLLEATKRT